MYTIVYGADVSTRSDNTAVSNLCRLIFSRSKMNSKKETDSASRQQQPSSGSVSGSVRNSVIIIASRCVSQTMLN